MPLSASLAAKVAGDGTPLIHPSRPRRRYAPVKALKHFRELLKDKENTAEVFNIFESLPSRSFLPAY